MQIWHAHGRVRWWTVAVLSVDLKTPPLADRQYPSLNGERRCFKGGRREGELRKCRSIPTSNVHLRQAPGRNTLTWMGGTGQTIPPQSSNRYRWEWYGTIFRRPLRGGVDRRELLRGGI